jgi:hypothetical protein
LERVRPDPERLAMKRLANIEDADDNGSILLILSECYLPRGL